MIIVLGTRLHGRGCAPSTSDVRILVPDTRLYTYPDVTVIRGRPVVDPDARNTVVNPSLIVEVLSKSTEAYDRGAKAAHYRRLESLQAYVFVAQREKRVEHYQRRDDGTWTLSEFTGGQTAFFSTLDIEVPVDEIYENADLYPSDEEDSGETTASR
jgi:Uma2 family endonuclease